MNIKTGNVASDMELLKGATHCFAFDKAFEGSQHYKENCDLDQLGKIINQSEALCCYISTISPKKLINWYDWHVQCFYKSMLHQEGSNSKHTLYYYVKQ